MSGRKFKPVDGSENIFELFFEDYEGCMTMARRSSMPHLEYQFYEGLTNKNVLYPSISSSQIAKIGNEDKVKRRRRKPRNKTPKQAPDNVSNMTPTIKKFHNVAQSNFEGISRKSKPSEICKSIVHAPAPSKQKQIVKDTADPIENKCNFIIEPVESPETGIFLRKRNSRYKYINLKSHAKIPGKTPCLFMSKSITNLTSKCEKLSLYDKEDMTKSQLRKFPQNLQQNEPSSSMSKKPVRRKKKEKKPITFEDYIDANVAAEGLRTGDFVKGFVRINPKNFKDAYVSNEDTSLSDYYLTSVVDRNRALEGDEVVLRIKPKDQWTDGKKTATVVHILKSVCNKLFSPF